MILLRYLLLILTLLLIGSTEPSFAQQLKRTIGAGRISETITIDGKMDEPAWRKVAPATDFIQNALVPGARSHRATEVRVLYDDNAIYVAAMMFDDPDSVYKQLTPRDDFGNGNTDVFAVTFDTYSDEQNGFVFAVTAAGVQADAKMKFDGSDYSWNAAWYSKVSMTSNGWCAEMKIPYAAIRFPGSSDQKWGVNFYRSIRRLRESSYWNTVLPNVPNFLHQAGILTGISDIKAPIRLIFLPYLSTYFQSNSGAPLTNTVNGGLDLKYGVNESFTVDLTLVPDFGQTLYDNKVLNLSPVEVKYDERRYFFTEGTDLFNKDNLFYSRRVGGTPVNFSNINNQLEPGDSVTQSPTTTKLINAVKFSGRTKKNLGIGLFNAISQPAYATVYNTISNTYRSLETSPLTDYNVVVLDQALKNNSYLSFINTAVIRKQNSYNADVSALLFKFANKANSYSIDGSGDISQLYTTRPAYIGYKYYLQGAKTKGNFTWYVNTTAISDQFNPNDLGYLDRNNLVYYNLSTNYNTYTPKGRTLTTYNHVGIGYNRVFNPNVFSSLTVYGSHRITRLSFMTYGLYWDTQPISGNDYLEPRTQGRFYRVPTTAMGGGYLSSDYRKKLAIDFELNNRWYSETGRSSLYSNISPRYRVGNKLMLVYSSSFTKSFNNVGYVGGANTDSIYFGTRDVVTLINALDAQYIFTNKMSLRFDARHYWSQANYSKYSLLNSNGNLVPGSLSATYPSQNVNFNSLNIYSGYTWQFKPGSEVSIVYQNSIYSRGTDIKNGYFTNLGNTLSSPQSNSLSVKIIYYLDYTTIKNMTGRPEGKL